MERNREGAGSRIIRAANKKSEGLLNQILARLTHIHPHPKGVGYPSIARQTVHRFGSHRTPGIALEVYLGPNVIKENETEEAVIPARGPGFFSRGPNLRVTVQGKCLGQL